MTQISEDDARALLEPFHSRLAGIVNTAFAEWLDVGDCRSEKGYPPVLYARTAANYIFDAIARTGIIEFDDDADVRIIAEPQTVKFCFNEQIVIRFKKANCDGLGQNVPTQAAIDFTDPQASLPGIPNAAAKIEVVWEADELVTEIETITILARNLGEIVWSYNIDDDGYGLDVVPLPVAPNPSDNQDDEPLVAVRAAPSADTGDE